MKLAIFFSLKQTNKKQQQQSIIPPPSQHITPGQRLFFSSFTPHKTHNVELYEFHSYLRPLMSLKICSSYNCSITFTIYKSVHFYSTVITITSCHILSFSQVLPGIKKDSFAYADFPCISFTLFFAFFFST